MKSHLIILIWGFALLFASSTAASAATFTVTNGNDSGVGSLRQAIINANVTMASDLILFATNNSIYANSECQITQPVWISGQGNTIVATSLGYTLFNLGSGASGSTLTGMAILMATTGILLNSNLNIVANCRIGTDWADNSGRGNETGVTLSGGYNCIRNNVISGNTLYGISFQNSSAVLNVIQGNMIGTNFAGTAALSNINGIYLNGGWTNLIGGNSFLGEGNLISGNTSHGIYFNSSSVSGTTVCGNVIGLSQDQTAEIPNNGCGIYNRLASGNWFGLPTPYYGNVIAGNDTNNLQIGGNSTPRPENNIVQNNIVGLSSSSIAFTSNMGIYLNGADRNIVGGVREAAEGNVVSGHITGANRIGIYISGNGNTVSGNLVGTDLTGNLARMNANIGCFVYGSLNIIGGQNASGSSHRGNLFSGNSGTGISVSSGMFNAVQGNIIGLALSGGTALGNYGYGIGIGTLSSQTLIGGANSEYSNVIAGNNNFGLTLISSHQNRVLNNTIGLSVNGTTAIHNVNAGISINQAMGNYLANNQSADVINLTGTSCAGNTLVANRIGVLAGNAPVFGLTNGMQIYSGAHDNLIGLPGGNGNLIANTTSYGIYLTDSNTVNNGIYSNTITAFSASGIYLINDANHSNPSPVITQAYAGANILGTANANDFIQIFLAESRSGQGGSLRLLGETTAAGSGQWSLIGATFNNGDYITALASDAAMNTSAFAANYVAAIPTATPTITATATPTPTVTFSPTKSATPTITSTPSSSATLTPSRTITHTPTVTATATITSTPTVSATLTASLTITHTVTITVTLTASPSLSPSQTSTNSPTLTHTPTISPTPSITLTLTISPTSTTSPSQTATSAFSGVAFNGKLVRAYPLPAKNRVNFIFDVTQKCEVQVRIYNFSGEAVARLSARFDPNAGQPLVWECPAAAAGIYLAHVQIEGKEKSVIRIAVIK